MKKTIIFALLAFSAILSQAQDNKQMQYRRNSLNVAFIDDFSTTNSSETSIVKETMSKYQMSDKYNDHSVGSRIVHLSQISVTEADIEEIFPKGKFWKALDAVNAFVGTEENEATKTEAQIRLDKEKENVVKLCKYIKSQHLPGLLVAKWFNLSNEKKDGSYFNMDLILERGAYNASELEKLRSDEALRGRSIVSDAGLDLIPNTFVVFSTLEYITAQEMLYRTGQVVREGANALSGVFAKEADKMASQKIYKTEAYKDEKGNIQTKQVQVDGKNSISYGINKKISSGISNAGSKLSSMYEEDAKNTAGYYVTATTYLFKLKWDEDSVNEFFDKYYESDDPQSIIYDDLYELEYLGNQTSYSNVTQSNTFNPSGSMNIKLIERATIRAIDESLALLQKEHEDFRVKAPIIDVDNKHVTAFIGTKEGINSSAKFEVLEQRYNENKNTYRYVRIGTVTVDKNRIWDNRYNMPGLPAEADDTNNETLGDSLNRAFDDSGLGFIKFGNKKNKKDSEEEVIDRTYFTGSVSKFAPGMLIRQIK